VSGADTCAGLHHRRSRLLAGRPSSASSKKPQLMMPSLARGDLFAVFSRRSHLASELRAAASLITGVEVKAGSGD